MEVDVRPSIDFGSSFSLNTGQSSQVMSTSDITFSCKTGSCVIQRDGFTKTSVSLCLMLRDKQTGKDTGMKVSVDANSPLSFYTARDLAQFCYDLAAADATALPQIPDIIGKVPMKQLDVVSSTGKGMETQTVSCRTVHELFTALTWYGHHHATSELMYAPFDLGPLVTTATQIILPGVVQHL